MLSSISFLAVLYLLRRGTVAQGNSSNLAVGASPIFEDVPPVARSGPDCNPSNYSKALALRHSPRHKELLCTKQCFHRRRCSQRRSHCDSWTRNIPSLPRDHSSIVQDEAPDDLRCSSMTLSLTARSRSATPTFPTSAKAQRWVRSSYTMRDSTIPGPKIKWMDHGRFRNGISRSS